MARCLAHVFSQLDSGDLRSARLVCKSWDTVVRGMTKSLCPTAAALPSRITRARYPALERLDLTMLRGWGAPGWEHWIPAIQKLSPKHLVLGQTNTLRTAALAQICELPALESLHVFRKQLPPGSHAELRKLPLSLRKLTLTWVHGDDSGGSSHDQAGLEYGAAHYGMVEAVAAVCSLPQLESLELDGCLDPPAECFAGLHDNGTLRALTLRGCGRLTADAVTALAAAPGLQTLTMTGTELDGTTRMRGVGRLWRLDLGAEGCMTYLDVGSRCLAEGLAACSTLTHLGLSGRGKELDALALAAEDLDALRSLRLYAVPLSRAAALACLTRLPPTCNALDVTLVADADVPLAGAVEAVLDATAGRLRGLTLLEDPRRRRAATGKAALQSKGPPTHAIPAETLRKIASPATGLRRLALHNIRLPDAATLLDAVAEAGIARLDVENVTFEPSPRDAAGVPWRRPASALRDVRLVGEGARPLVRALAADWPGGLEQCLLAYPGLRDADVVGLAATGHGPRVLALVGPGPGNELSLAALRTLVEGCPALRRLVLHAAWNGDRDLSALLSRAPRTLCQVTDTPMALDQPLDSHTLGAIESFSYAASIPTS